MKVHLFGASSSPGCANFGLKKAADDDEEEFGNDAALFIRRDFYVDDGLKSVPTAQEAVGLINSALCLRLLMLLGKGDLKKASLDSCSSEKLTITLDQLQKAEKSIIKAVQYEHCKEE